MEIIPNKMTNIKFNIDQPDLPDEQINKHKDFKKLIYNYQAATKPIYKTPLYKNKKVFLVLLLVVVLIYVAVEIFDKEDENKKPIKKEISK